MIHFYRQNLPQENFLQDVIDGLSKSPKQLPPKYFYDRRGSEIFEEIVQLQEYYVPNAELDISSLHSEEIAHALGDQALALIELGSGSSEKIRKLIDLLPELKHYIPVDISETFLRENAEDFAKDHPHIQVSAICADYTADWQLPENLDPSLRKLIYFPGSTIGNLSPEGAQHLLRKMKEIMGPDGLALVGADRVKDVDVLEKAYNDSQEVTAKFNKNLLARIVKDLGGRLDPRDFLHKAIYNREKNRIEMHLFAQKDLQIEIQAHRFFMKAGESIHTESSHKYSPESFSQLVSSAGLKVVEEWTDSREYFSVYLLASK